MEILQIYFKNLNKLTVNNNFLAFFLLHLNIFPLVSGSAYWMRIRIQERKWMRIRIHIPGINHSGSATLRLTEVFNTYVSLGWRSHQGSLPRLHLQCPGHHHLQVELSEMRFLIFTCSIYRGHAWSIGWLKCWPLTNFTRLIPVDCTGSLDFSKLTYFWLYVYASMSSTVFFLYYRTRLYCPYLLLLISGITETIEYGCTLFRFHEEKKEKTFHSDLCPLISVATVPVPSFWSQFSWPDSF